MAFQSGVAAVGSDPYVLLTWLVALTLVGSVMVFVSAFVLEGVRAVRFSRRLRHLKRQSLTQQDGTEAEPRPPALPGTNPSAATDKAREAAGPLPGLDLQWVHNPLLSACAAGQGGPAGAAGPLAVSRVLGSPPLISLRSTRAPAATALLQQVGACSSKPE
jgi:hypothetical protein